MRAIWEQVKRELGSDLQKKSFSLWISPITFIDQKEETIILGCPNNFSRNWVQENYLTLIQERMDCLGSNHFNLVLKVLPSQKKDPAPATLEPEKQLVLPQIPRDLHRGHFLKQDFTFDRFVVGSCNEFAYSASNAIANGSSFKYNSLLMTAETGLGKSHLSQAVGHAILEKNPACRVYYVTAEEFTNEMVSSLKNNRIEAFKEKYRKGCDVLLLEEVHFLGGKEKTQLELGRTLDALANDNKRILFTSALPPQKIPDMSKELSSRLTSGLITTIDRPDYETRINILKKKASDHHMVLPEGITSLLAAKLNRDIRQMESALKSLKAKSELLRAKIDEDLAKEVIHCLVPGETSVTSEQIKNLVCTYYKVDPEMLRSKSRKKIYAHPRNVYVYLCRNQTGDTLEKIARSINRTHSTALYASEVIEHKMKTDEKMRNQVKFLERKLEDMKR
jgi:chromosomal replication initiator protein